jgi:hypothetical protein
MIVHGLTLPAINEQLVRGPFILVPGVRRAEGRSLLRQMGKAAGAAADLQISTRGPSCSIPFLVAFVGD